MDIAKVTTRVKIDVFLRVLHITFPLPGPSHRGTEKVMLA